MCVRVRHPPAWTGTDRHGRARDGLETTHDGGGGVRRPVLRQTGSVRVTAKTDYALRALVELAAAVQRSGPSLVKAETIAERQQIPLRFLLNILADLRVAKLVDSRRGSVGGYWLAADAATVSVADVIRVVEGPLADVHGQPPEALAYPAPASTLRDVWLATRAALRGVLEHVTLADIVAGHLPDVVRAELGQPGALHRR